MDFTKSVNDFEVPFKKYITQRYSYHGPSLQKYLSMAGMDDTGLIESVYTDLIVQIVTRPNDLIRMFRDVF